MEVPKAREARSGISNTEGAKSNRDPCTGGGSDRALLNRVKQCCWHLESKVEGNGETKGVSDELSLHE